MKRWILLIGLLILTLIGSAAADPIRLDETSERVRSVQEQLARLGYYDGEITGHYGTQSYNAMSDFRADFGLGEGGEADDATVAQLMAAKYRPMRLGTHGTDVKRLQTRLMYLGYYGGKVSGNYLSATSEAIKVFQTKMGLSATGDADALTQETLFSDRAVAKVDKAAATPAPPVPEDVVEVPDGDEDSAVVTVPFKKKLAFGDSGSQVKLLQQRLTDLGYYSGPISGSYQGHTRNAVKAFQKQNAITVNGKVGKDTWNAIFNDPYVVRADEAAKATPRPEQPAFHLVVDVTNQIVTVYARDEEGEYTVVVKEMMCSSGTTSNPSDAGDFVLSGYKVTWCYFPTWGDYAQYWTRINAGIAFHSVIYNTVSTKDLSIRSYERLGRRASHGCVRLQVADAKWIYDYVEAGTIATISYKLPADPELKASIIKPELNRKTMLPVATPQPTQEPIYISGARPPLPLASLKKGDSGEAVWWLQKKLAELGYYTGKCSGTFLDGTQEAVRKYQQANGLRADGVAGVDTLKHLYAKELSPILTPTPVPIATPAPAPQTADPTATRTPRPTPKVP
ncbi:MAG: peptidoglycan-binding protein [Clostridia bacterium]|nr:peptidoglycan-binding protein [Clostridia bacterium]